MKSRKSVFLCLALPVIGIASVVLGNTIPREIYTPLTFNVGADASSTFLRLSGIQFKSVTPGSVYYNLNDGINVVLTKNFPGSPVPYGAINSKLLLLPEDSPSSSVFPDGVAVNIRLYVLVGSTYIRIVRSDSDPGLTPSEAKFVWIRSFDGTKPYSGIFGGYSTMSFDFSLVDNPPGMTAMTEYPVYVKYIIPNYIGNSGQYTSQMIKIGDLRRT